MSFSRAKRVLFLLRTYNDIDHIAPVMWKTVSIGWPTFFVFVEKDYSEDYRIKFLKDSGARQLKSVSIEWYHEKVRGRITVKFLRRLVDRLVAYSFGLIFVFARRIGVIANEWSGPFGRARSEYFLRPAHLFHIPIYSLPHGYFLWRNTFFNKKLTEFYRAQGTFPDFSNRDWFTKYVVQSNEHKSENVKCGMNPEKIIVLGSARFCKEWSDTNLKLLLGNRELEKSAGLIVVFFLPHWDYNVDRKKCTDLLMKISQKENVTLNIKAHTRGTGALSSEEIETLSQKDNVKFPDESAHSATLVYRSDVIINFGSSIAFEALRQGKPVINPRYLHGNDTFFDDSGTVIDTVDEAHTLSVLDDFQSGGDFGIQQDQVSKFLCERLEAGRQGQDVLQSYVDLLSGEETIVQVPT
jgi:hypothetical protein